MSLLPSHLRKNRMKKKVLKAITIVVGLGGLFGQLLLMRELMVTFYGNELTIGVVIAIWLFMEAVGAYLGGRLVFFQGAILKMYSLLLLLYALALPISLYYSRGINTILFQLLPGQTGGLDLLFISSLVLLAPPAVFHGALYPFGAALLRLYHKKGAPGLIYKYENLGTLLGGLIFTLILAQRFHSLFLGLWISLLHVLIIILLLYLNYQPGKFIYVGIGLLVLFLISLPYLSDFLHKGSLNYQWRGQELIHYQNTPYGNVLLLHNEGEYTLFYDGRPWITLPTPDLAKILDYGHLALSSHPEPKRVLLLGGGVGGLINEILKHPVEELVFVELDPDLPRIIKNLDLPLIKEELSHERVTLKITDGRRYLKNNQSAFDLILLEFIVPETLQMNRLFTVEFFQMVKENLNPDGLFVFNGPGSPHYLSPEVKLWHGSYYKTAKEVFSNIHYLPGELGIFMASQTTLLLDGNTLYQRLVEREIQIGMLSEAYLTYRLDPFHKELMTDMLKTSGARINTDLAPASFYYTLRYWGSIFTPHLNHYLAYLEAMDFKYYLLLPLFLPTLYFVLKRKKKRDIYLYAIFCSGILSIAFDLLLLFLFQSVYGYLYSMSGLLLASFMFGLFSGGQAATGKWIRSKEHSVLKKYFRYGEVGILFLAVGCAGVANQMHSLFGVLPDLMLIVFFLLLAVLTGFPVGFQFPLATALTGQKEEIKMAGSLYAADLFGGFVGGLLISILLFPLLGLIQSIILLALLKLGSLALLFFFDVADEK